VSFCLDGKDGDTAPPCPAEPSGIPIPRHFAKRVRKALKINGGLLKKSDKRVEECATEWRERR